MKPRKTSGSKMHGRWEKT